jgi:two-component system NtrC family response regulator/two-component system response regulator HydG
VADLVGNSAAIRRALETVGQVGPTLATVLVSGEAGTGKELVATLIHRYSPRAEGAFVRVSCRATTESVLDRGLYGDNPGVSLGNQEQRLGALDRARGGTLYLQDVGDIPLASQARLLRALQDYRSEPVGGAESRRADIRLVAGTQCDLAQLVTSGAFRQDLYYRLQVVQIELPPLRQRVMDVPPLAVHFLRRYADEYAKPVTRIAEAAMLRLAAYPWPGNVRELQGVVERAVALAEGDCIEPAHLPGAFNAARDQPVAPVIPGASMAEIERHAILSTLVAQGGSTRRAAQVLGISVRKIQYKLQEYGSAPRSGVAAIKRR